MAMKGFHSWSNHSPFNRRMCRGIACVGGTMLGLAACAPTAQAKVQKKAEDHVILVGSTGSGKSSTANLLFTKGSSADDGPFKVSHGGDSMTADIAFHPTPSGMIIVDTPGLGDVPPMEPGETPDSEQYKARKRQRSSDFFERITKQLRATGGLVLDVVRSDRITDRTVRHRQALNAVLGGSYSSSTVLVLTNIPETFKYTKKTPQKEQKKKQEELLDWARQQRKSIEDHCGVRFAAVLTVSNSLNLHKDHPANPARFATAVEVMRSAFCLPPETAFTWTKLISRSYKDAEFAEDLEKQIESTTAAITRTEKSLRWANMFRVGCTTAGVAVTEVFPPASAAALPVAAVMSGLFGFIKNGLETQRKDQKETLAKKKEQLAECNKGRTTQQLKAEAKRLERLVFDD